DPDTKLEAPTRDFVDVAGAVREFLDGLGIDRRDRRREGDAFGGERETGALRHVGERARYRDAGKAAPLDLARRLQRGMAPSGCGDQVQGGQGRGHALSP